jgi:lipid-A-disaccharide synthase
MSLRDRPLSLVISAVEASGDVLAAGLVEALSELCVVQARGVAGPAMRAVGVAPLASVEDIAANGLWEVLRQLGPIQQARKALLASVVDDGADLVVFVDGPDFHLPLARKIRALDIPVVGYVGPQVWAWRPGRAKDLAKSLDRLLCLFPFEPEIYAPHGLDARFVGHPAVDRLAPATREPKAAHYALLPGSRQQEIARLLPVFLEVAARVRQVEPTARFRVGRAATVPPEWLAAAEGIDGVEIVDGLVQAASCAQAALTASGTATLELAILDVPMVIAYAVHPLTYVVGKWLVRGVEHIGLPNILAGESIVPEHIQTLDPDILAEDLRAVSDDPALRAGLVRVRSALGPAGGEQRAARALLDYLPAG